jgi:hypothetical protein
MEAIKMSYTTTQMIEFGHRLGLDLNNCSISVASAILDDLISREFWGAEVSPSSPKQINFARSLGINVKGLSMRVASAMIGDVLHIKNIEAINQLGLEPGISVMRKNDMIKRVFVISSISDDGTVYFKGGNGNRAWARNLIKVEGI